MQSRLLIPKSRFLVPYADLDVDVPSVPWRIDTGASFLVAAMDNYRLKIKLGDFEFDAEGPHDVVQAQFQAFQEMVASLPKPSTRHDERREEAPKDVREIRDAEPVVDANLNRIMRVENRVVSLTVRPQSQEDAALLIIYGQRMLRDNEAPTGSEIVDGAEVTGGLDFGRSARLFEKLARQGDIISIGERRGKRYRLTNAGLTKARQIAGTMLALIA